MLQMKHELARKSVSSVLTQLVKAIMNVRRVKRASSKTVKVRKRATFVSKAFTRMKLVSQYARTASQVSTVTARAEVLVLRALLANSRAQVPNAQCVNRVLLVHMRKVRSSQQQCGALIVTLTETASTTCSSCDPGEPPLNTAQPLMFYVLLQGVLQIHLG